MSLNVVILAAGKGTRMRSSLPKVLHPVANKPMVSHVIETARKVGAEQLHLVYGHGAELLKERIQASDLNWVLQAQQLGTGHAVAQAIPFWQDEDDVLVLYGDTPLIQPETLQRLLAANPSLLRFGRLRAPRPSISPAAQALAIWPRVLAPTSPNLSASAAAPIPKESIIRIKVRFMGLPLVTNQPDRCDGRPRAMPLVGCHRS